MNGQWVGDVWFDKNRAVRFQAIWQAGSPHYALYRTRRGNWVLELTYLDYSPDRPTWMWVTPQYAAEWLASFGYDLNAWLDVDAKPQPQRRDYVAAPQEL